MNCIKRKVASIADTKFEHMFSTYIFNTEDYGQTGDNNMVFSVRIDSYAMFQKKEDYYIIYIRGSIVDKSAQDTF